MTKKNKSKKFSFFINGKFDYTIIVVTVLLLCIGLIMLLSASAPASLSETGDDSYQYIRKQGLVAGIGIVMMIVLSKVDYRIFNL